jgi:hypothetical protein
MRLFAFALLIALLGHLASIGGAAAQTPPDVRDAPQHIRNADQIKRVCDNMRTTRRTPPFEAADQFFLDAIDQYCAFGEFVVDGTNERNECQSKKKISKPHLDFIKQLHLVRPQPVRQIAFSCVTISGPLLIQDLDASAIQFFDVDAEDVRLTRVKLSTGFIIRNSRFKSGLGLIYVAINGLRIQESEFGNNSGWGAAFATADSAINSIWVNEGKFRGNFDVAKLPIKEDFDIIKGSIIDGTLNAVNATIGGTLNVNNSTIKDSVWLDYLSAARITIDHATFGKNVRARYVRIEKTTAFEHSTIEGNIDARGARFGTGLLILDETTIKGTAMLDYVTSERVHIEKSTFEKSVWLDHSVVTKEVLIDGKSTFKNSLDVERLHAYSLKIDEATVQGSLSVRHAKLGSLDLTNATIAAPKCQNARCEIDLYNADIDYIRVRDVVSRSLDGGNARMRVMLLGGKTSFERFQCGDCLVEQYALVAARFNGPTIFSGAEIKGTLSFREGDNRVTWGENASLSLSELRADTIAANACDLVLEQQAPAGSEEPVKCVDQLTFSHKFVPTTLTGARYRSIVPGRSGLRERPANPKERLRVASAWETMPLLDLSSTSLIRFLRSAGSEQYNPQPYEQLAEALSTMGKSNEAVDIRVARINERVAHPDTRPNVLVRVGYFIYYYVSHYGFKNWQAFLYFVGLILAGSGIKLLDQRLTVKRLYRQRDYDTIFGMWLYSVWFSLDRAVPPLHLDPESRDRHMAADQHLQANIRHWFYCHRVIGTILISIFAAGLAGVGH